MRARVQQEEQESRGPKVPKAGGLFVIDIVPAPKTNILGPTFGLEGVETMPLEIYDAGIAIMQDIPEVEHVILTAMFWPEKPNLSTPDKNEAGVKARREEMQRSLQAAILPLETYIASLEPLQTIVNMDVAATIKEWETKKPEEIATGGACVLCHLVYSLHKEFQRSIFRCMICGVYILGLLVWVCLPLWGMICDCRLEELPG